MSFRSEAAKVRAGLDAGDYKKKSDPWSGFFDELTYGLKKRDEEARQEEIVKRREARAAAKSLKAKQDAEDKKQKSQERLANLYLTTNGIDKTDENRAKVLSVITDGGITGYTDLNTIMSATSTYTPGSTDEQMIASGLSSPTGTITFGKSEKNVLSMKLDEVNFELSSTTISQERRALLERRKSSLTDPSKYEPTTLYKSDGSQVTARTQAEEDSFISQGFSLIKGADGGDFKTRTLYKDGASVQVFSNADLTQYKTDGWSEVKPQEVVPFKQRTLYKDGQKQVVFSQTELDTATANGWSAIEPAVEKEFKERTLYKEGAEVKVYSEADLSTYKTDGWSEEKPAKATPFTQRTLYKEGAEQVVTTQAEMDTAIADGFSAIKDAPTKDFVQRTLYKDGAEIEILSQVDLDTYEADGWSPEKPAKATPFVQRTLYKDGAQQVVTSQAEMDTAIADGFSAIKAAPTDKFDSRLLYKDGAEVKVFSSEELATYEADGWSAVKPATTEKFAKRTLFADDGREIEVFSQDQMNTAMADGFSAIKPAPTQKYTARTYYKDGQEIRVLSADQQAQLEQENWSPIKLDDIAQIMADLEVDRKTAAEIKNGTRKVTSDGYGRPMLLDIVSGKSISVGGEVVESDLEASSRISDESLTEEDIAERDRITQEAIKALQELGFEGDIEELKDVGSAFGPTSFFGKGANAVAGLIGGTLMPNTAEAKSSLDTLRIVTTLQVVTAFPGIRDSVQLKESIKALIPEAGRFWTGRPQAARNLRDIKNLLDQAIINQRATANDKKVNTTAQSKAEVALNALEPLSKIYEEVLSGLDAGKKSDEVNKEIFKPSTQESTQIKTINNQEEYDALPTGTVYIYLGKTYTKGQ